MITMEAAVEIDATAEETWAVLADYARDVEWRRGVRSMVPTPSGTVRTGTTTAETMRAAGRTLHDDGVVTGVEQGRRFTWRTTSGVDPDRAGVRARRPHRRPSRDEAGRIWTYIGRVAPRRAAGPATTVRP